jgi:hypothetical protein
MRKPIILIIALIIYGVLVGEAWALRIQLGHHSSNDIRRTCGAVGGDFFTFPDAPTYAAKVVPLLALSHAPATVTAPVSAPPAVGINPSCADRMKLRAS